MSKKTEEILETQEEVKETPVEETLETEEDLEVKDSKKSISAKARENGLLSLTKTELVKLAKNLGLEFDSKLKKEKLAGYIRSKKMTSFCLNKKVGYAMVKNAILGYAPNVSYPVDQETLDTFVKYKVLKR